MARSAAGTMLINLTLWMRVEIPNELRGSEEIIYLPLLSINARAETEHFPARYFWLHARINPKLGAPLSTLLDYFRQLVTLLIDRQPVTSTTARAAYATFMAVVRNSLMSTSRFLPPPAEPLAPILVRFRRCVEDLRESLLHSLVSVSFLYTGMEQFLGSNDIQSESSNNYRL